jgi:hypothetical protein
MAFALVFTPAAEREPWSATERDALAALLREIDPSLDAPIPGDDDAVSLVPRRGIGVDWVLFPDRLVASPQVTGVKPAEAERVFSVLLQCAHSLVERRRLALRLEPAGDTVDLEADHEVLARAWLEHCTASAHEHLAATRGGSRYHLVAVAVLVAILVAASQLPAAAHPLVAVFVAVPLAFLVLLAFRNRRQR